MAITRAQQAKQMLQNGGRIGLRFGNRGPGQASRESRESRDNRDRGMGMSGKQRSAPTRDTGGRDPMAQFSPEAAATAREMRNATMGVGDRFVPDFLPTTKAIANLFQISKPTPFDLQRRGFIQALGTKPVIGGGGGGDSQGIIGIPTWMRLGFSSEAEYLASLEKEDEKEDEGLRLAFRADGGRIGAQEGGIMPRLNQLGSGVSSAEQTLQEINQRLESAESSLGSDGVRLPEISGNEILPSLDSRPTSPFMGGIPAPEPQRFSSYEEMMSQRMTKDVPAFFTDLEGVQRRPDGSLFEPKFGELPVALPQAPVATRTGSLANLGMGIPAAGYADGGNVVGGEFDFESARQMYGLGKLVKKVTRTVKKIAKSPIGKAALLYGGFRGFQALGGGTGIMSKLFGTPAITGSGRDFFMGIGGKSAATKGILGKLGLTAGGGSLMPTALGSITAASALAGLLTPEQEEEAERLAAEEGIDIEAARNSILARAQGNIPGDFRATAFRAEGGPAEGKEPVAKKTMPLLDMGGQEMDLRAEGGFVPIGRMEKADDVPARLSKNEFVFTADAVRNAGDGDVDKGAEVMYNMMKNLEAGGEVSKESQGLEGARKMFQTSQRLEEVL